MFVPLPSTVEANDVLILGCVHVAYMTVLWYLGKKVSNRGLVDFGWPSGFTALAVYFYLSGDGYPLRSLIITSMFVLCGSRFMLGFLVRTRMHGEDRRWQLWRERWQAGEGWFGLRSVDLNFFFFYQAQALFNILLVAVPLGLCTRNPTLTLSLWEYVGCALWALSFALENVADFQLKSFKQSRVPGLRVCKTGLWQYSRHPNYFFEFLIWVSYALFSIPSAKTSADFGLLLLLPLGAYWFLVYFTGIPITEQSSLKHRGDDYRAYIESTPRFFPRFWKS